MRYVHANHRKEGVAVSIRLSVEANDAEVESLLAYLDSQSNLHPEDKIYLLERTVKWLRAADENSRDWPVRRNLVLRRSQGEEHADRKESTIRMGRRLDVGRD